MNTTTITRFKYIYLADALSIIGLIISWTTFLSFDGKTNLDINQTFTFPLMAALEITAISLIYGIWRYNTSKGRPLITARALIEFLYRNDDKDKGKDPLSADTAASRTTKTD